ncbi:MAG: hypothetical protein ACP5FT_02420 [Acidilobus sp.]
MEDIYQKDPLDLIDSIMIRLEIMEKDIGELASSERARGKMVAIAVQMESIRETLTALREKCRGLTTRPPSQP